MRWFTAFLCLITPALAQDASLDDARVQLSYKELRSLIEAAAKPQPTVSPVASALLSARYQLRPLASAMSGTAEFEVQTFRDGPNAVPLVSDQLIIDKIEPKEAVLVTREGNYVLIIDGKSRTKVSLGFSMRTRKSDDGTTMEFPICPAVTSTVEISDIPAGRHASVEGGVSVEGSKAESTWHLGHVNSLKVAFRDEPKPLPPPVTMPAVIASASSEMRLVGDGGFSNKMTWRIRHQTPLVWKLALPETCQIVSARIGRSQALPSRADPKSLEFRLPDPIEGETVVELSYTGKAAAFQPVRGEIAVDLPSTPLLIETLTWKINFPSAYDIIAVQGNVDFLPGNNAGEIQIKKELCQGDSPNAHLFYQKPETRK